MLKKFFKFLVPIGTCMALFFSVAARAPAPYVEDQTSTQPWNDAYATLKTRAEITEGKYASYLGGSWKTSTPPVYQAYPNDPDPQKTSYGLVVYGKVQFSFYTTYSPMYTLSHHYYY